MRLPYHKRYSALGCSAVVRWFTALRRERERSPTCCMSMSIGREPDVVAASAWRVMRDIYAARRRARDECLRGERLRVHDGDCCCCHARRDARSHRWRGVYYARVPTCDRLHLHAFVMFTRQCTWYARYVSTTAPPGLHMPRRQQCCCIRMRTCCWWFTVAEQFASGSLLAGHCW